MQSQTQGDQGTLGPGTLKAACRAQGTGHRVQGTGSEREEDRGGSNNFIFDICPGCRAPCTMSTGSYKLTAAPQPLPCLYQFLSVPGRAWGTQGLPLSLTHPHSQIYCHGHLFSVTLANLPESLSWGSMMEHRGMPQRQQGAWGGAWEKSRVTKTPPHTHTQLSVRG